MTTKIDASGRSTGEYLDRRSTIKFIGLGSIALLSGVGFATPAYALAQEGWRWCNKCQGMFYGAASQGVCPAGGTHNSTGSGHYYQRVEGNIPGVQQGGWRWCNKCQGFFYGPYQAQSSCPAGGLHAVAGSGSYAAVLGETALGQQGGWRWCNKCQGMFYSAGNPSVCPKDHAQHNTAGSGHYATLF